MEEQPTQANQPLPETGPSAIPPAAASYERYDLRILSSLRRITRAVDVYSRRLIHEHGVTLPQLTCMLKVEESGSLTQKELSDAVYLNQSTIVGIVDRLEKAGIFVRERSLQDRRRIRISLTPKGRQLVAQSPSPLQDSPISGIERLPELEKATIALSLERLVELINTESVDTVSPDQNDAPNAEGPQDFLGDRNLASNAQ